MENKYTIVYNAITTSNKATQQIQIQEVQIYVYNNPISYKKNGEHQRL